MRRLLLVATAAVAAAGCGGTEKEGEVGDKLAAGGLNVTLAEFDSEVPRPRGGDITGLGTPGPGMRFFGAKVRACNDSEQAINTSAFGLELHGGDGARVRFPQRAYDDGFENLRDGCEAGWIVFEAPTGSEASKLTFEYDDTGQGGPGGQQEKHVDFRWKL